MIFDKRHQSSRSLTGINPTFWHEKLTVHTPLIRGCKSSWSDKTGTGFRRHKQEAPRWNYPGLQSVRLSRCDCASLDLLLLRRWTSRALYRLLPVCVWVCACERARSRGRSLSLTDRTRTSSLFDFHEIILKTTRNEWHSPVSQSGTEPTLSLRWSQWNWGGGRGAERAATLPRVRVCNGVSSPSPVCVCVCVGCFLFSYKAVTTVWMEGGRQAGCSLTVASPERWQKNPPKKQPPFGSRTLILVQRTQHKTRNICRSLANVFAGSLHRRDSEPATWAGLHVARPICSFRAPVLACRFHLSTLQFSSDGLK